MFEEEKVELTGEELSGIAGGKDDDGGKGAVICPRCTAKNYPAHNSIRDERRFSCWRCGYSRELKDEEVNSILGGQGMSWPQP